MSLPPATIPSAILHRRTTHIPHDSEVLLKLPSDKIKPVFLKPSSTSIPFDETFRNRVSSKLPTVSGAAEKEWEKKIEEEKRAKEKTANGNGKGKAKQVDKEGEEERQLEGTAYGELKVEGDKAKGKGGKNLKETNTLVSLGKFGSFDTGHIVGLPYGHTYEISDLDPKDPKALKVVLSDNLDLEETDANNEMINDDGANPTITFTDIQELKNAGLNGREIIQKQMELNQNYELKTVYSKEKYAKRKESKYVKTFTPLSPTLSQISQHHFERNPERVRNLRPDSFSQVLGLANIRPGGRYLIVDSTGGLLAGGCLERMGGEGLLLALNDSDSPPAYDVISQMNLHHEVIDRVLAYLNWSMVSKDWKPEDLPLESEDANGAPTSTDPSTSNPAPVKSGKKFKLQERERLRLEKRRELYNETQDTREELFKGEFDGLIISSHYEPVSIIDRLLPYLSGSANVLVHGPYLQPLIEAQARLRLRPECLSVTVTEPWLRRYQVLPGRTHPEMQTSATGGYILHFLRILTDEEAERVMKEREAGGIEEVSEEKTEVIGNKRKVEEETSEDTSAKKIRLEEE